MKGHWIPFLATTAALALAVVAPAQDRGRRTGGGGGNERSSPTRSGNDQGRNRGGEEKRSGGNERSRGEERRSGGDEKRSGGNERTREDRRSGGDDKRSGGGDDRPTRTSDPGSRERRPSNPPTDGGNSGPSNGGDRRPNRTTDDGSRRNPFERSRDGNDGGRDRTHDSRNDRSNGGAGAVLGGRDADRTGPPQRERPSRSGKVSYGTRSNGYGTARPVRFSGGLGRISLNEQIRRTGVRTGYNVTFGGIHNGLRVGYCAYNTYWRDDYFCYPFYVFNPWQPSVTCVASPWYRYSYLPPYINNTRVIYVNNYVTSWNYPGWADYNYQSYQRDRRNEAVGDALDDIRDSFERNNVRYGDRLVPLTGQVAIFNEGKYDYSLSADDFRDMFLDGVEQSKTVRYEIVESQTRGDELRVRARHEYADSWGAKQVVYHSYTLRAENGRYVIREFGTD